MKGVILCGGMGTRLRPATLVTNKHLVPIANYPMVLFPLNTLRSFGVTDILIITGGDHVGAFAEFLGDGSQYGCKFTYRVQMKPGGIPEALALAEGFVGNSNVMVILGDNIFGDINKEMKTIASPSICVKKVSDASRFGVLMDDLAIVEKPKEVKDGWAVTGLYIYPPIVFQFIRSLKPSARGELEITDVNNYFLDRGACGITRLTDTFWSDCGTPDSLANTTRFFLDNPGTLIPISASA